MADSQVATMDAEPAGAGAKDGLRFELAGEEYFIDICRVREVIGLLPITPVPDAPEFLRGLITLGGRVIPVVDLKFKFGMDSRENTRETCLIVADVSTSGAGRALGFLVDRIRESSGDKFIATGPGAGTDSGKSRMADGGRVGNPISLDIDKVLTAKEISQLQKYCD